MPDDTRLYNIWAQDILGFGTRRAQSAIDFFKSMRGLFDAKEEELLASGIFSLKHVKNILAHNTDKAQKSLETAEKLGFAMITYDDGDYPHMLRNIYSPPLCLYVAGDASLLSRDLPIAMVGAREPNSYGLEAARLFSGGLSKAGAVIISGLAVGIDAACHSSAIDAGGYTVAVTGCGLDIDYPKQNRALRDRIEKLGCVVSEYAPGTPPFPAHFPIRNRIISGLSLGCVVVQGAEKSGSLVTAGIALSQGRDVFAVCGSVNDPLMAGCHELIRQGAKPVFGILDVLGEYSAYSGANPQILPETPPNPVKQSPPDYLNDVQAKILEIISQSPKSVDEIALVSGINPSELLAHMTELEIFGLAECMAGRTYRAALR